MYFYTISEKGPVRTMLRYELLKIFTRRSNQIALLLLAVVLGVTCGFALDVGYVNEQGETQNGPAAVAALRQAQKAWAGPLDEAKIRAVLTENQRIAQSPQARSQDVTQVEIAYSWGQGIMGIRDLINHAYAKEFHDYDYYLADRIAPEAAPDFYANRVTLLKTWLEDPEAQDRLTPAMRDYLVEQYEALPVPMDYDYMKGWTQLFEFAPTVVMVAVLVLGYLVAGIFSCEFTWHSDALFFSAYHGRGRGVRAKVLAGFVVLSVVYWVLMLLYSLIVLGYLGFDGWNCPIQAADGWKSFYNLTLWQQYLLVIFGGYLGCLFMGLLTMLVSAKTRSAVVAVIVPFALIFLPSFLSGVTGTKAGVSAVMGLLPDRLLQVSQALKIFDLYELGGRVVGAVPLLLLLYGVLALVLVPVLYRVYRRLEAG